MLTAYDYPTALHADRAGVDVVLVGDSLGMVVLGYSTTQPVTLDHMLHHSRAARRGVSRALLVADLPFGSYETCSTDALRAAFRLVKDAGVDAVKLEGGTPRRADTVRAITEGGVAVMGHVGLTPQAFSVAGGFRAVGKTAAAAARVVDEALALEDAGAFAIVVECVPAPVAKLVTESVSIPTFGIGAGRFCNGQVLVYHDMLGVMAHPHHAKVSPRFSKQFAPLGEIVHSAIHQYSQEVRKRQFPSDDFSPYKIADDELAILQEYVTSTKMKRSERNTSTLQNDLPAQKLVSDDSHSEQNEDISLY